MLLPLVMPSWVFLLSYYYSKHCFLSIRYDNSMSCFVVFSSEHRYKNRNSWAGEMAQSVMLLTDNFEDLHSVPTIHTVERKNSVLQVGLWFSDLHTFTLAVHVHTHTDTHTLIHVHGHT